MVYDMRQDINIENVYKMTMKARRLCSLAFLLMMVSGATLAQVQIGGSVFGGGNMAEVEGDVTVNIVGGEIQNDVYGGGALAKVNTNVTNGTYPTTTVNLLGGKITGNAYGGGLGQQESGTEGNEGYIAAVAADAGNTKVNLNGMGTEDYKNDEDDAYANYARWDVLQSVDGRYIVKTNRKGCVVSQVFGGNNLHGSPKGNITVHVYATQHTATAMTAISSKYDAPYCADKTDEETDKDYLKRLIDAATQSVDESTQAITWISGVDETVLAAAKATYDNGNATAADITTAINSILQEFSKLYDVKAVYGGGNQAAYDPATPNTSTTSTPNGSRTHVIIEGCDYTSIQYVYGGGNAAPTPSTEVEIRGSKIIDYVFGGGNGKDDIMVNGVQTPNPGADVGIIDQSAYESNPTTGIYGTGIAMTKLVAGNIHTVFGGSNQKGNVRGGTDVSMPSKPSSGVTVGTGTESFHQYCPDINIINLYGAGQNAAQDGGVKLVLGCIENMDYVFGGAKDAHIKGGLNMTITSGTFKKIFGGNDQSGTIQGPITLNIEETGCAPIIIEGLYLGGNQAPYSVYGYKEVEENLIARTKAEFEALYTTEEERAAHRYADPILNVISCTRIDNVYGGGLGSTADMYGNPTVNINMVKGNKAGQTYNGIDIPDKLGKIGNVYGGGEEADVYGNTTVNIGTATSVTMTSVDDIAATENIDEEHPFVEGANITGNVFGGGNEAEVYGNARVYIGTAVYTDAINAAITAAGLDKDDFEGVSINQKVDATDPTTKTGGMVFGGGNEATVKENTYVTMAGGTVAGNIYGGGNLGDVGTFEHPEDHRSYSWAEGTGVCHVTITGGTIGSEDTSDNIGHVFGAGKGITDSFWCDKAMVYQTDVCVDNGTVYGNVYGGGEIGRVQGNVEVTIGFEETTETGTSTPVIKGSVFGAGCGDQSYGYSALARGNTQVTIQGHAKVENSVYGGGEIASVGYYRLDSNQMPYSLVSDGLGICRVTVQGNAQIGPDTDNANKPGNVYGGGKGTLNGDYTFDVDNPPHRMTLDATGNDYWETLTLDNYHTFLQTLALATQTEVSISDNALVKGSVYGGSENGIVQHNTKVQMDCEIADENPVVNVAGSVYGGGKGNTYDALAGLVKDYSIVNINGGTIQHNVYGGGEIGSIGTITNFDDLDDTDHYNYKHGTQKTDGAFYDFGLSWPYEFIYGTYTYTENNVEKTDTTGIATVTIKNGNIMGNVFGGGKGNVSLTELYDATLTIQNQRFLEAKIGNVRKAIVTIGDADHTTQLTIDGSVYGGGENGHVYNDTHVTINKGTIEESLFGGGDGTETFAATRWEPDPAHPDDLTAHVEETDNAIHSFTAGKVYGNTHITMNDGQVKQNVFGGGKYGSVGIGNYAGGSDDYSRVGYGELPPKNGDTEGALWTNDHFTKSGIATVTILGGTVGGATGEDADGIPYGNVFGSSRGLAARNVGQRSPRYMYVPDFFLGYTNKTTVTIGETTGDGPIIRGSVYGGGQDGHVRRSTDVIINKGTIGAANGGLNQGNVFGAGSGMGLYDSNNDGTADSYSNSSGSVTCTTTVTVNDGTIYQNVYGGGAQGSVGPPPGGITAVETNDESSLHKTYTKININGGNIGSTDNSAGYGGNVYGASRGNASLPATVYATDVWSTVNVTGDATITGSVYGGGENGIVRQDTKVNIGIPADTGTDAIPFTGTISQNVFGGGKAADVGGSVIVTMSSGTVVNDIYGGGALANTNTGNWDATRTADLYVAVTGLTVQTETVAGSPVGDYYIRTTDTAPYTYTKCASDEQAQANTIYYQKTTTTGDWVTTPPNDGTYYTTQVILRGGTIGNVYGGGLGQLEVGEAGQAGYVEPIEAMVYGDVTVLVNGTNTSDNAKFTKDSDERTFTRTVSDANNNVTTEEVTETVYTTGRVFGCNNLNGTPKGNVTVTVWKTTPLDDGGHTEQDYEIQGVYGGGNLAEYIPAEGKKTQVNIHGCEATSILYVFGGGNAADVPETDVNIYGCFEIETVFGGGNGNEPVWDYTQNDWVESPGADVPGTAKVTLKGGLIHSAFAGSFIKGTCGTTVITENSTGSDGCVLQVTNMYGGGKDAPVENGININITGCSTASSTGSGETNKIENIYAGSFNARIWTGVTMNITGGIYKNVYGGNHYGGFINGPIVINVEESETCKPIIIENLYGGGNYAAYPGPGADVDHIDKKITINIKSCTRIDNIYAGSYSAPVTGDTEVNINMTKGYWANKDYLFSYEDMNDKTAAQIKAAIEAKIPNIVVDVNTINTTDKTYWARIKDEIGTIGNVYGGGNMGDVSGSSVVNIGTSPTVGIMKRVNGIIVDETHVDENNNPLPVYDPDGKLIAGRSVTYVDTPVLGAHITGNVYGGGNLGDIGVSYTDINGTITINGKCDVNIGAVREPILDDESQPTGEYTYSAETTIPAVSYDANNNLTHGILIDGNVFGGGAGEKSSFYCEKGMTGNLNVRIGNGTVDGNVYGGGEIARTEGNTTVTIGLTPAENKTSAPVIKGNVFGGAMGIHTHGYSGLVRGTSTLTVQEHAKVEQNVYGGGQAATIGRYVVVAGRPTTPSSGGDCTVTIQGDAQIGTDAGVNNGHVFGGGKGLVLTDVAQSEWKSIIPGNNYVTYSTDAAFIDYLETLALASDGYVTVSGNAKVKGSVFGGSENGHIQRDTKVTITGNCEIGKANHGGMTYGNVYGGGKGNTYDVKAGLVKRWTEVAIDGGTILHNVYGGGAYSSVGQFVYDETTGLPTGRSDTNPDVYANSGNTLIYITGGTIGTDGHENGMVFGSSRGDVGAPGLIHDKLAWVYDTNVIIGDTTENATVTTTTPLILGSVYGGGENGHNLHSAYVHIHGGTIGMTTTPEADLTDNLSTDYDGANYPYRGNVYGAGCGTDKYYEDPAQETHDGNGRYYNPLAGIVQGDATVVVDGGHVVHNVYGGGAMGSVGTITNFDDLDDASKGYKHDAPTGDGAFYDFGLSWPYELTYGNTGKTNIIITGNAVIGVSTSKPEEEKGGRVFGGARGSVNVGETNIENQRYVEAKLANVRETHITIGTTSGTDQPTIYGSVLGGGEDGHVNENAYVIINDGTIHTNVFGGGKGEGTFITQLLDPTKTTATYKTYGEEGGEPVHSWTAGKVYGNTYVTMNGGSVDGFVFAGGNLGSVGKGNYAGGSDDYSTVGYGELPPKNGDANGPLWTNTDFTESGIATVNIFGGTIGNPEAGATDDFIPYGSVFGGSRGKTPLDVGRLSPRYKYVPDFFVGYVNKTIVNIGKTLADFSGASAATDYAAYVAATDKHPVIYGSIYGGGQDGHVRNSTEIHMNHGQVAGQNLETVDPNARTGHVFGAGSGIGTYTENGKTYLNNSSGSVTCTTLVEVNGGSIRGNIYGGGAMASVGPPWAGQGMPNNPYDEYKVATGTSKSYSHTQIDVNGGAIGGNIFGASRGPGDAFYATQFTDQEIAYDESKYATDIWSDVNITGDATIAGSVYGGGERGIVKHATNINIGIPAIGDNAAKPFTGTISQNVFGGGMEAIVGGHTTVNMFSGTVTQDVYGGGALAHTGTNCKNEVQTANTNANLTGAYDTPDEVAGLKTTVNILGGQVRDVYGGGLGRIAKDAVGTSGSPGYEAAIPAVEAKVYGDVRVNLNGMANAAYDASVYGTLANVDAHNANSDYMVPSSAKGAIVDHVFGANNLNGTPKGKVQVYVYATQNKATDNIGLKQASSILGLRFATQKDELGYWLTIANENITVNGTSNTEAPVTGTEITAAQTVYNNTASTEADYLAQNKIIAELLRKKALGHWINIAVANSVAAAIINEARTVYTTAGTTELDIEEMKMQTGNLKAAIRQPLYDVEAVYGGGNLAAYDPVDAYSDDEETKAEARSELYIDGCDYTSIYEVYGGSNAASVPASFIGVNAAYEIEEVFGGGNGRDNITVNGVLKQNPGAHVGYYDFTEYLNETDESGALKAQYQLPYRDYYDGETTYVGRDERVNDVSKHYGSGIATTAITGGTIHSVYGGSNTKGIIRVAANSSYDQLNDDCPMRIDDTYGAGKNAEIDGSVYIDMSCIAGVEEVFGGAKAADLGGDVMLTITNGSSLKRVFGGNNTSGLLNGSITVNVKEGGCEPIWISEGLFAGGYLADYSIYGYKNTGTEQDPKWEPRTKADFEALPANQKVGLPRMDPQINIISATHISNVYGGGYKATVVGNPHINVNMEEGRILQKYMSAFYDGVNVDAFGNYLCTIEGRDDDGNGIVSIGEIGNIYGGGYEADIIGDTYVDIGTGKWIKRVKNETTGVITEEGEETLSRNEAQIYGNVFGGGKGIADDFYCKKAMIGIDGEGADNNNDGKPDNPDGGTHVTIYNGTVNGSVYGGGEIGRVEKNTMVTIGQEEDATNEPIIGGDVFGAGKGVETHGYSALVRGNPTVIVQGKAKVLGSVYGGGEIASVARYQVLYGSPVALANDWSGNCIVTIRDDAEIGPDGMQMKRVDEEGHLMLDADGNPLPPHDTGHVFGAGKGVLPGVYDYADETGYTGTYKIEEHKPRRMLAKLTPAGTPTPLSSSYSTSVEYDENNMWEYFGRDEDYHAFIETLALSSQTDVTIEDNAFVKGSVYGGSLSGIVQYDTHVTIADDCQIGQGSEILTRYKDYEGGSLFELDTPPIKSGSVENGDAVYYDLECAHWDYDATSGASYDPYAKYLNSEDGKYYYDASYTLDARGGSNVAKDGHTYYGNVFGGGSGIIPYAPGKWHRAAGQVRGNTVVDIKGGHILTSAYGGNEHTDVGIYTEDSYHELTVPHSGGNCTVNMVGGTLGVPRTLGQIAAHPVTCYLFGAGKGDQRTFFNTWTNVINTYVNITGDARIFGSVFGGGEDGHIITDTETNIGGSVTLTNGTTSTTYTENGVLIGTTGTSYVDGNVFGAGRGFSGDALTAGSTGGNVTVNIKGGTMLGSVYGGGRLASVGIGFNAPTNSNYGQFTDDVPDDATTTDVDETKTYGHVTVNISGGTIGNDLEDKHYAFNINTKDQTQEAIETAKNTALQALKNADRIPNTDFELYDSLKVADDANDAYTYFYRTSHTKGGNVFGGSMGRLTTLNGSINPLWPQLAQVKNATVNIWQADNAVPTIIKSNVYGGAELGTVRDNTTINIGKDPTSNAVTKPTIYRDVFGGGYGSLIDTEGSNAIIETTMPVENGDPVTVYFGYTPMKWAGMVGNGTTVNIYGGWIKKTVYGGGEMASVGIINYMLDNNETYNTKDAVPANKVGFLNPLTQKYSVYQNITKHADIRIENNKEVIYGFGLSWPYKTEYVPGYEGTTHVNIYGGRLGITGKDFMGPFNADNKPISPVDGHELNKDEKKAARIDNGDVYGGGKGIAGDRYKMGFCANVGSSEVTIDYTSSDATPANYKEETSSGIYTYDCITGSVYGGASDSHVMGDTHLTMNNGLVGHAIYGGGKGKGTFMTTLKTIKTTEHPEEEDYTTSIYSVTAGKVYGNTYVTMNGGYVVRNVYGGGNMGSIGKGNYAGGPDDYSTAGYGELPEKGAGIDGTIEPLWTNADFLNSGKTTVTVTGGQVGYIKAGDPDDSMKDGLPYGNIFGGCRGESAPNLFESPRYHYSPQFFSGYVNETKVIIGTNGATTGPKILGSVYGGGQDGHVRRDTYVMVNSGEIGIAYGEEVLKVNGKDSNPDTYITDLDNAQWLHRGNIYGAGSGIGKYQYDFDYDGKYTSTVHYGRTEASRTETKEEDYSTSAGSVTRFTQVDINGGIIHRNVYGGGSLASVGAPKIPPITIDPYRKGDTNTEHGVGKQSLNMVNIAGTIGTPTDEDAGTTYNEVYGGEVYGASRGMAENTEDKYATSVWTEVNLLPGARVQNNVFGGGDNGMTRKDADVNVGVTLSTQRSLSIAKTTGSQTVNVTTETDATWTATSNADWLTLSPASGTGNGTITATATENTTGAARTATITLSSGTQSQTIQVTQAGE